MNITDADKSVLHRCLEVASAGELFEDWEFQTLFGLERGQLAAISAKWPDVDQTDPDVDLAVTNAVANLLGYPHGKSLEVLVGATHSELRSILALWRS